MNLVSSARSIYTAEHSGGAGSFRAALFDFAGNITPQIFMERLDIDED